jgi:SAM-dependent methyltransferase
MSLDVVDLRAFYTSPLGQVAHRLILSALRQRWEQLTGLAVLGLGYTNPYLDALREGAERSLSFMPALQGVMAWPPGLLSCASLVEPTELPLRDQVIDRVLIVHALEMSDDPASFMREIWRVLTPGGHVLLVVPNRRGPWIRLDTTPFGQGQPYSRRQLTELMRNALFTPIHWGEALHVPPIERRLVLRAAPYLERIGAALSLPFSGVHVIEATKQVYRPAMARKLVRMRGMLEPILVPAGGATAGKDYPAGLRALD